MGDCRGARPWQNRALYHLCVAIQRATACSVWGININMNTALPNGLQNGSPVLQGIVAEGVGTVEGGVFVIFGHGGGWIREEERGLIGVLAL